MKLYRLVNRTQWEPASGLFFLRREEAEKYKELVKWPYANDGVWPLSAGHSIPLERLDLRVELAELNAVLESALAVVVMERDGVLGTVPFLPGDCFDPDEWAPCSPSELAHPVSGPRLEQAQKALKDASFP